MTATKHPVEVTLRVPGVWRNAEQLLERLPEGFRLTHETLLLPDGAAVEFTPMPPDGQFAGLFDSACRQPLPPDERATLARYTVNIGLSGPGGSMDAALTMMQAGVAIVRAGGAGVFIDNSALAHGGGHWIEMADNGGSDALSFAFVAIVNGQHEVWTMGMHVLGFPEIVMCHSDLAVDPDAIIDVVRYVCGSDKPIGDGHLLGDENGPRFQARATSSDERFIGSPMHNPFGRLRLTSLREIAEGN